MKDDSQPKVQLYILSRNRPDFLKEAIDSVLNQNHSLIKFEIIISDNSENDDVQKMIDRDYAQKNLKYIRRDSNLSFEVHCQLVASELSAKYAVLFHDDDILLPDYMETMSSFLNSNDIAAVGCNAMILKGDVLTSNRCMRNFSTSIKFDKEKDFLERYLPGNNGMAPLPGYMYRTKYLKQAYLNMTIIGKHSDAVMLSSLLNYGEIVWLEKILMNYRVHSSNISVLEKVTDRLVAHQYMIKKGVEENSTNFILARITFWSRWILQQGRFLSNITRWRYRTVVLSILLRIIKISMRPHFWKIIFLRFKNT
mgnify:CR=1 FL=1